MTKQEPVGWVWIDGKQRPVKSIRLITRGKKKGLYEVTLCRGRLENGEIRQGAKRRIKKESIINLEEG